MVTSPSTDARLVRTRNTLLQALLRLLETRPFDQVTIREIAAEAGIGYATFFRHYASKQELLHDLAADEIAGLLARAVPVLYSADSRQSCAALFAHVAEHRALWTALLTGGAAPTLKEEFIAQARRLAEDQRKTGGVVPDDLRILFGVSGTIEILAWWLQQEPDFPIERMPEILDRLVVAPAISEG